MQCLDRRIADLDALQAEVNAWQSDRNMNKNIVSWQFTADDARIKLKCLYPKI